ncbi:hypothetical protein SAMN04515667_1911 [Formosa sp. Hel1_31_208]|uniref:hypothetical protein n=1 Tax=Formosa sp. Hel1_31_208 TaxID=1798225 RepID=UPI00087DC85A|nr:hypothetical protein [Formosa sp. Hel1_31_208]SDS32199.1 hypothetical protein SAMN04515667_1911 [Formosa sp. Hel1_31_208]
MKLKLLILVTCLCLFNCKEGTAPITVDYKYQNSKDILNCEGVDTALIQEAFYSFENDLTNFYTPEKPIYSRAYSLFVSQAIANKVDYSKMVSEHSKNLLEVLKQNTELWTTNPDGSKVNFSHPVFKCIGANIQDKPLKDTFNALVQTNSMSLRMFGDELKRKTFGMKDDKYLATYVALELFYGKIYDVDLSQSNPELPVQNTQEEKEHTSHDGHNH